MDAVRGLVGALAAFVHLQIEGWAVVALIALLVLYAGLQLCGLYRRIREEEGQATLLEELASRASDAGATVSAAELAVWSQRLGGAPGSLAVTALEATSKAARLPNPDPEAAGRILDLMAARRVSRLRLYPNRLMLLGLAGTVLGLAAMVGGLGPQVRDTLNTQDPRALTEALGAGLRHMSTAFGCTLWGITSATILTAALGWVQDRQTALVSRLRQLAALNLAPLFFPRSEAAHLEDVRRILEESRGFLERTSQLLRDSITEFSGNLAGANAGLAQSVEVLQNVAATTTGALREASEHVGTSARHLREVGTQVQSGAQSLRALHQELQTSTSELTHLLKEVLEDLVKASAAQLEQIHALQHKHLAASDQLLGRHLEAVAGVQNAVTQHAADVAERLRTSTELIHGAAATLGSASSRLAGAAEEQSARLATGMETISSSLAGMFSAHRSQLANVASGLDQLVLSQQELTNRLDPRLLPESEWTNLRLALGTVVTTLEQLAGQRQELLDLLDGRAAAQQRALEQALPSRALLEHLDAHLRAVTARMGDTRDPVVRHLESLVAEVREMRGSLVSIGSAAAMRVQAPVPVPGGSTGEIPGLNQLYVELGRQHVELMAVLQEIRNRVAAAPAEAASWRYAERPPLTAAEVYGSGACQPSRPPVPAPSESWWRRILDVLFFWRRGG